MLLSERPQGWVEAYRCRLDITQLLVHEAANEGLASSRVSGPPRTVSGMGLYDRDYMRQPLERHDPYVEQRSAVATWSLLVF